MRRIFCTMALIVLLLSVLCGLASCSKPQTPAGAKPTATSETTPNPSAMAPAPGQPQTAANGAESSNGPTGPCALLSSAEIQQIQGELLKETKASTKTAAGLNVAECFFTLPTSTNSISLAVTRRGDVKDARDPRSYWKEKFHREREAERDGDKDRKEEADSEGEQDDVAPLRIGHVGDEAFWVGNAVGGTLYALKGNTFVRVSIGGSADQQSRMNKSKALVQFVLKHL